MTADAPTHSCLGPVGVRIVGTLVGAGAFCFYNRAWEDLWKLIYDITAALAVYSFLAQLLAEILVWQINRWWWWRFAAVVVMSIITVGREFFLWPVSGHISTVTGVAIIQVCEVRLSRPLRWAYLLALPITVAVRALAFEGGLAVPMWSALAAGTFIGGGTVAARRGGRCVKPS